MHTQLNQQEQDWLLEQKIRRITDNQEVLIYPMGAERYLSLRLSGEKNGPYDILADIRGKDILVIPGYGNSAFLFAQAGAKSVQVYDKDPLTIAWVKAFKKYYHYRGQSPSSQNYPSIGEVLTALTAWYPPLLYLPKGHLKNRLCWMMHPKALRRTYIYYIISLVAQALKAKVQEGFEWEKDITFHTGELSHLLNDKEKIEFDTVFIPYLLGVKHGVEQEEAIITFIKQALLLAPKGHVVVTPTQDVKEFHWVGQSYFETTGRASIQSIPDLKYCFLEEERDWFKPQGIAVFGLEGKEP